MIILWCRERERRTAYVTERIFNREHIRFRLHLKLKSIISEIFTQVKTKLLRLKETVL